MLYQYIYPPVKYALIWQAFIHSFKASISYTLAIKNDFINNALLGAAHSKYTRLPKWLGGLLIYLYNVDYTMYLMQNIRTHYYNVQPLGRWKNNEWECIC